MTFDDQAAYINKMMKENSRSKIERDLLKITSDDVEYHTAELLSKHVSTFTKDIGDELERTVRQNFNDSKDVKDAIAKILSNKKYGEDGVLGNFFDNNFEANPDYKIEADPDYQEAVTKAYNSYKDNALTPLRHKLFNEIREAYKKSIQNEIDLAKKEAEKEAKSKTDSLLIDQSPSINKEVRTLKTTLNKDIRKAAKDSELQAENDFIEIEETGAEIPK